VIVGGENPDRTGNLFHRAVPVANASAAAFASVTVIAARPGTPDQVATETRTAFVAKTPESFAYDLDGNLTQDGRWDYTWDAENRLTAIQTRLSIATAFPALNQRLLFAYDAQGRRIRKVTKSWNTAAGGSWLITQERRFVYDGWNLLAELDASVGNAVRRSHVWGLDLSGTKQGAGGVGGLLWSNTLTHTFAASADANGNIVAYINTANLAMSGRADYGAFGEIVQQTGVAKELPFGFSTKYLDTETGLNYYGFRYYNPQTGRWPNRDPIEEEGGNNLYAFVDNSPIDAIDPDGLWKLKFAYDRNFSVASRGYVSVGARGDVENGNGSISVSIRGGVRFFISEVIAGGPGGTLIGVLLQKRNISQEGRIGVGGSTTLELSCPRGGSYLYAKYTEAKVSISAQAFIGYQGKDARALGQASGGGEWDLLTGRTSLTGNVGVRFQLRRGSSWIGWDYSKSGNIPLPFKFPKFSATSVKLKLPVSCDCMKGNMDGGEILNKLFNAFN